jgi:pSer/pThr/pTyr-binding forkhead associated (FHA) protein
MRRGPTPNKTFELTADVVTIGSGTKNTIVIHDHDVSREHCRLTRVMADYEVEDLNSTRGTYVGGLRLRSGWILKPGNIIELGENITLEYDRGGTEVEMEKVPTLNPFLLESPDPEFHPYLVMTFGPKPGHVYNLTAKEVTLGRDLTNNIVIQDPEISRFHLILRWIDNNYEVEDLGSTNGTLLNGEVLPASTPRRLNTNDLIQVATMIELRYTWQPGEVKEAESKKAATPKPQEPPDRLRTSETKLLGPSPARKRGSDLGTGLLPGALIDHIFITYAREDWEQVVAPLTVRLQDAGLKVWVDQYLVQGGDDWMVSVEQALAECWLLIVVASSQSLESRYVRLAYRYFFNREKPIITLLYNSPPGLPRELANTKSIPFKLTDTQNAFPTLIKAIKERKKD